MLALLRVAAIIAVAGGVFVLGLVFWPVGRDPVPIELTGDMNRGAYLARASGCIACHTDTAGGGALSAKTEEQLRSSNSYSGTGYIRESAGKKSR